MLNSNIECESVQPWTFFVQATKWIARTGDSVYETAGSAHAPEALEDTEIFLILIGELLFLDENGQLLAQENWKTSAERYRSYCEEHGLEPKAITSFTA